MLASSDPSVRGHAREMAYAWFRREASQAVDRVWDTHIAPLTEVVNPSDRGSEQFKQLQAAADKLAAVEGVHRLYNHQLAPTIQAAQYALATGIASGEANYIGETLRTFNQAIDQTLGDGPEGRQAAYAAIDTIRQQLNLTELSEDADSRTALLDQPFVDIERYDYLRDEQQRARIDARLEQVITGAAGRTLAERTAELKEDVGSDYISRMLVIKGLRDMAMATSDANMVYVRSGVETALRSDYEYSLGSQAKRATQSNDPIDRRGIEQMADDGHHLDRFFQTNNLVNNTLKLLRKELTEAKASA
jgi:hypothetical protein